MPELIGAHEIARRIGVPQATVRAWSHRGLLGDPDIVADGYGRSLWLWEDVESTARTLAERWRTRKEQTSRNVTALRNAT